MTIKHNKIKIILFEKNIKKKNFIQNLFLKLNTLKQQLQYYILFFRFMCKTLRIVIEKQLSRAIKNKIQTRKKNIK